MSEQISDNDLPLDFSFVLASSVHDMKNSVGMLMQTVEELAAMPSSDSRDLTAKVSVLGYEAARINGELIQLLALYRMQNQRMLVQLDEYYIDDIIQDQLTRNDTLFCSRNIQVDVECADDVCWYVDAELLGSVLNNLLVNAARYCKCAIKVAAYIDQDKLHLLVADDGNGYPDFMLENQGVTPDSVSFDQGSTNLGLVFAREIARLHKRGALQGEIQLSNNGLLQGGQIAVILP